MAVSSWKIRLVKDTLKAVLPFKPALRAALRTVKPYQSNPANDRASFNQGMEQIAQLKSLAVPLEGAAVLELGSGWMPIIPALFWLAGARKIHLTDQERLLDDHTVGRVRDMIGDRITEVSALLEADEKPLLDRLESFRFDYHAPFDAGALPAGSLDIVLSRTVLEHIAPDTLIEIMRSFHRLLRPDGVMAHVVDNSDHWEHHDKSISRLNFLQYDERLFRLTFLNKQNYQNRLRHSDYAELFPGCGFEVLFERGTPDMKALTDLNSLDLADRFKSYEPHDLAVLTSKFILRRKDLS